MSDIGIKLNVDGEKAFNSALRDINSGLRVLSTELKATSSRFYENNKSVESFTAQNKVLEKQIDAQNKKVAFLKDTLKQATEAYGESDKRTQAWATKLNLAQSELNKMNGQLSSNNKELDKYSGITSKTAESIGKLDKEMSELKNGLDAVDKKYGKNKNSVEALNEKQGILSDILGKQSEKVKVLGEALDNSKKAFGDGSHEAKKFEQALSAAETELKETQKDLKNVDTAMQNTGKSTKTFGDTLKANLTSEAIIAGLKKIKDAVKGVGSYVLGAVKNAASFGRGMSAMSEKTGISTEVLQKFSAAARITEVQIETFTKAYSKSIKSMDAAASSGGKMADTFRNLGVDVKDSAGKFRDSQEVFWETIDALKNMDNETERNAAAMQIFGKSAMELNPIIMRGSEGFLELTKSVATFDSQTMESLRGLDISMMKFSGVMDGIKRSIGVAFAPMMKEISDAAADTGGKLRGIFTAIAKGEDQEEINKKFEGLKESIKSLAEKIREQMPLFIDVGGKIIGALFEGMKTVFEPMLPQIIGWGAAIAAAVFTWKVAIGASVNALSSALSPILSGMFVSFGAKLAAGFASLSPIVSAGMSGIMAIINLAIAAWPITLGIALAGIITYLAIKFWPQISEWLNNTSDKLKAWGKEIGEKISNWFSDMKEKVPKKAKEIIDNVVNWFKELPGRISDAISGAVGKVREWADQVKNAIENKFSELKNKMHEIGENIVKGLWNGINGMAQWARSKISGFIDNIKKFFTGRSGFDTHSPSLWAKKIIGENIALGIGAGITGRMPDVLSDINKSIPSKLDYNLNYAPKNTDLYMNNVDVLAKVLKKALNGMPILLDEQKVGEFVIDATETVVFA
jgi:septal ring factor EnvC (AmiA/AmiB activator)